MTGDHQLVREMFRRDDTNTRCEDKELASYMEKLRGTLNLGIVNGVGKKWQEQSRFMTTALREFGFGKVRYLKALTICLKLCAPLSAMGTDTF